MKKTTTTKKLKFLTLDEVFEKSRRSPVFRAAYEEEIARLRLASEIRKLRTKKHLTQAAVAKAADMPQSVIARIEGGNHAISLGTLNRIAHALGKQVALV